MLVCSLLLMVPIHSNQGLQIGNFREAGYFPDPRKGVSFHSNHHSHSQVLHGSEGLLIERTQYISEEEREHYMKEECVYTAYTDISRKCKPYKSDVYQGHMQI